MSVSNYTPGNGCKYQYSKLKDRIYLVSEDHVKKIYIDNGEAYISGLTEAPLLIEGFNIEFKEDTSLDERYLFDKTLSISMDGYANITMYKWCNIDIDEDYICYDYSKYYKQIAEEATDNIATSPNRYYAIIETIDGTFYMINVDFPSKISYTYNLSKNVNQTDFTFRSLSNYPTLKVNGLNILNVVRCKGYQLNGINGLHLIEKENAKLNVYQNKVIHTVDFKMVKYLGESCSFQETFDGREFIDELSFDISFDNYKPSWQYNLLEFMDNVYSAVVELKGDYNRVYTGFNFGLEPQYSINAANDNNKSDTITITLTERSNVGLVYSNYPIEKDVSTNWRNVRFVNNIKAYECYDSGEAIYLLQEETNAFGTPTGRYKAFNGYAGQFPSLNIIDYFSDEVLFYKPDCQKPNVKWVLSPISDYYCYNKSKYWKEKEQTTDDDGQTWYDTGKYRRGLIYEADSIDCGYIPATYRWIDTTEMTCYYYDKVYISQQQVSYDGGITWENTPVTGYGSVVEYSSEDCGYIPPTPVIEKPYLSMISDVGFTVGFVPASLKGDPYGGVLDNFKGCSIAKIFYSKDNGQTWYILGPHVNPVTVYSGERILFKGHLAREYEKENVNTDYNGIGTFVIDSNLKEVNIEGNVMSLLYDEDFEDKTSLSGMPYVFSELFSGKFISHLQSDTLMSAENLILPATTLSQGCYSNMFDTNSSNCTLIGTPPELPATELAPYCYAYMFAENDWLRESPVLSAETLAPYCYLYMFSNALLNNIKCLATDIRAYNSTQNWVQGVGDNGTFIKNASMSEWAIGDNGIPSGWDIQNN